MNHENTHHKRCAVAFTIPELGHVRRMLPVVAGLCDAGVSVHFFAGKIAQAEIERTGAHFVDMYTHRTVDSADAVSRPEPIRYVSFAGRYGDDLVREVTPLEPELVLHDTFAVIGRVVASQLNITRIDVRAGHNLEPTRTLEDLRRNVPIVISDECNAALRHLRNRHGMPDASPFSYFLDQDADLNLYPEPPEFLPPDQRHPFAPLEFFGSYWPGSEVGEATVSPFGPEAAFQRRIYISFGTVIWRHAARQAMAALECLVSVLADVPDTTILISLGGHEVTGAAARLIRPNVRVESYVDQIRVLKEASIFITHHGLNSTHEALYNGVPMISYPFFGDQPDLAARCREMGLAVPLGPIHGDPLTPENVRTAMARMVSEGETLRARLAEARVWEIEVIRRRPEVVRRILRLMRNRPGFPSAIR